VFDPVGVGQVYVGDVDGNVHVKTSSLRVRVPGMRAHSRRKADNCTMDIDAVHESSVGVAVWPPTVEGLHGDVDGNVHVKLVSSLRVRVPGRGGEHSRRKADNCTMDIDAVHESSVGVAVWPPTVEGLHVDVGGVSDVTVVLPSGQVIATAQASCSWLLLAVAVLLISFVLSAAALELESLVAVFVFEFVFVLLAEAFCIIGNILVAPTTSIDVIATTIMILLIV
jgi:hypothetical protein